MARDSSGAQNQPQYAGTGAPADAADLTEVATYAALVGNIKVGTTTQMNALTGADRWTGLLFSNTTDGAVYRYDGAGWNVIADVPVIGTVAPKAGFTLGTFNSLRRVGKVVIFQAHLLRSSGTYVQGDYPADIPVGFRPATKVYGAALGFNGSTYSNIGLATDTTGATTVFINGGTPNELIGDFTWIAA